jgi:membrane protein
MARLRDLVFVVREYGAWSFFKRLYTEINEDNVFTNAAAMAYAWMFAVFPFVIFLLTLIPYLPDQLRGQAVDLTRQVLEQSLTPTSAQTILGNIGDVVNNPRGGLLSVGLILTLFAASGGMNATMTSLDMAFDVEKPRKYVWKRIVAMMLTVFMCLCLIVIVIAIPIGSLLTKLLLEYNDKLPPWAQELFSGGTLALLTVARYIIGLTVMQILIGVIYHFGRSRRNHHIRFFTPGSILAAIGWIGTGMAMRYYVENFANYSKTYGAVAGMVVMLMIFYINAIIILIGAELDSEIRQIKSELASDFRKEAEGSRPHA